MTSLPTVLFVLAQRLLHLRRHLDALRIDAGTLNTSLAREGSKHRDAEHDVASPPFARFEAFAVVHPIRVRKADCQILGVLAPQVHLARKRHEVPPDCAVAPQRSSAIAKFLQLA